MSAFKGKKIFFDIYGESHSPYIGANVYNFPKIKVDFEKLNSFLLRRKTNDLPSSSTRIEDDIPLFYGIKENVLDNDFSFEIKNNDIKRTDYSYLYGKPRPSHADFSSFLKDGTVDFSGGGRFSGRMTLPFCVIGGICLQYLEQMGISISAYISQIGNIKGLSYKEKKLDVEEINDLRSEIFPSLSRKQEMFDFIKSVKDDFDAVGGKIECIVQGLKGGIGDSLFNGLESKISSLIFSVPAVKGVEFGLGFDFCNKKSSVVNDQLYYSESNIKFYSNNSGGINGGISNGEQITIGVAIKPTPSIGKEQKTVDLIKKENTTIKIVGRHDSCILPRALPCVESAVAIAIVDEL